MKKLLFILILIACKAQGQITITFSGSSQTATPGADVEILSGTYVGGRTYIFFIGTKRSGGGTPSDDPTISDGDLTLIKRGTVAGSYDDRWIIYTADVVSDVTTAITFTYAESQGTKITGTYYAGINLSYTYGTGSVSAATANPTITLTAAANASIATAWMNNADPFGGTPETGWTEDTDAGNAVPVGYYLMHRNNTSDNTPTVTASASNHTGIALRITGKRRIIID